MARELSRGDRLDAFAELIQQRRLSGGFSQERLEHDLELAAQAGQTLLEEVEGLKEKLGVADATRDQLLDRLAASYKANAALEKRLERQLTTLETAEASNRSLLITLEEDRKTISRLIADQARSAGVDERLRDLIRERDDLRQELDAQSRKANAAESKAKRASVRLTEVETRLISTLVPTEEEEVAPTLSCSSSVPITAAQVPTHRHRRVNPSTSSFLAKASSVTASTAPVELLELIQTLIAQNTAIKGEAQELQSMLDLAREEQHAMQTEIMNMQQPWLVQTSKESRRRSLDIHNQQHPNFASELMQSTHSEPIPALSPTMGSESARDSWSPILAQSRFAKLQNPLASSANSEAGSESGQLSYHLPDGTVRPAWRSRRNSSKGTVLNRSGSRRTKSVDMMYQQDYEPSAEARSSLEPIADVSPVATRQLNATSYERPEPTSPTASRVAPSLLTQSSATQNSLFTTQDSSAQTEISSVHSPLPSYFRSSTPGMYSGDSTTSDLDHQYSISPGDHTTTDFNISALHAADKTAALVNLIDHASKLLTRLKNANVASLEVRLKKQNLPGDVSHLAKTTVKDIMSEIDAMRDLFRKLFDQERIAIQDEAENSSTSLVGRRDFFILVRLLRDVLSEIGRLRNIVNRVQLEPQLATKMAELDAGESLVDDPAIPTHRGFLAPLSRLFSAGNVVPSTNEIHTKPSLVGLRPSARPVPKLTPSSGVTSDTVVVKRQVSSTMQSSEAPASGASAPAGRSAKEGNLLRSIFAGGSGLPGRTSESWMSRGSSAAPTGRQMVSAPLTQATDAVLDTFSRNLEEEYRPNLLERQLRPRGLSDSSIRSAFIAHAIPNTIKPAQVSAQAYVTDEDLRATLSVDPHRARDQLTRKISRQQLGSANMSSPSSSIASTPVAASPLAVAAVKASEPASGLFGHLSSWAANSLAPLSAMEQSRLNAVNSISASSDRKRPNLSPSYTT